LSRTTQRTEQLQTGLHRAHHPGNSLSDTKLHARSGGCAIHHLLAHLMGHSKHLCRWHDGCQCHAHWPKCSHHLVDCCLFHSAAHLQVCHPAPPQAQGSESLTHPALIQCCK